MSFIDIEGSRVWPSAADEAAVAHEEVREAAVVGIWGARRRGSSMGSVRGRSGREAQVLAQEASEVVMVT
jgi:acyl-coenzyme A synthetase/AMP-(fatty) acid ligase